MRYNRLEWFIYFYYFPTCWRDITPHLKPSTGSSSAFPFSCESLTSRLRLVLPLASGTWFCEPRHSQQKETYAQIRKGNPNSSSHSTKLITIYHTEFSSSSQSSTKSETKKQSDYISQRMRRIQLLDGLVD